MNVHTPERGERESQSEYRDRQQRSRQIADRMTRPHRYHEGEKIPASRPLSMAALRIAKLIGSIFKVRS